MPTDMYNIPDALTAVSPIDGRYRAKAQPLAQYFSEAALIRYRIKVEVEYFIALTRAGLPQLLDFQTAVIPRLRALYQNFTLEAARRVKQIEATTNHDVKAVEYYIKEQFQTLGLEKYKEFIHFGLTSQDINNTAVPMSIKDALEEQILPKIDSLISRLPELADQWKDVPLLAHTHGQPASPTRLGKEIRVFVYRLEQQYKILTQIPITGKFGGATGNFNAHNAAYPNHDWVGFGNNFLAAVLRIGREQYTTQISNYDYLAALLDGLCRIGTIILDLDRDIWMYISMNYFKQRIKAGEVGSSAMPHKVNPIDFENSEGNIGVANALFTHLARKLPVSRLQRDLTDSTVLRNIGVPLAHLLIAIESTAKGLDKLIINQDAISADLQCNWAVVAEGIQTILRREGYPNPYETLKALTRTNTEVNRESIARFIDTLDVSDSVKEELRNLSPETYTGI